MVWDNLDDRHVPACVGRPILARHNTRHIRANTDDNVTDHNGSNNQRWWLPTD